MIFGQVQDFNIVDLSISAENSAQYFRLCDFVIQETNRKPGKLCDILSGS